MKNVDLIVAENIKIKLKEMDKKQTELGNFLNMPRQTINKMINGQRTITANEINKIAEFFSCNMEDLMVEPLLWESDVKGYLMGHVSGEHTKKRIDRIYELSKIYANHIYINLNKWG